MHVAQLPIRLQALPKHNTAQHINSQALMVKPASV
jgi:hypothetical protein